MNYLGLAPNKASARDHLLTADVAPFNGRVAVTDGTKATDLAKSRHDDEERVVVAFFVVVFDVVVSVVVAFVVVAVFVVGFVVNLHQFVVVGGWSSSCSSSLSCSSSSCRRRRVPRRVVVAFFEAGLDDGTGAD